MGGEFLLADRENFEEGLDDSPRFVSQMWRYWLLGIFLGT